MLHALALALLLSTAPDAPLVVSPPKTAEWIPRPTIKPYGWSGLRVLEWQRGEFYVDGRDSKRLGRSLFLSVRFRIGSARRPR